MEIVKKEKISELELKSGRFQSTLKMIELAETIDVGDAVVIRPEDWQGNDIPKSSTLNNYFRIRGIDKLFKMKSLYAHKGWVIIRTK